MLIIVPIEQDGKIKAYRLDSVAGGPAGDLNDFRSYQIIVADKADIVATGMFKRGVEVIYDANSGTRPNNLYPAALALGLFYDKRMIFLL